MAVKNAQDVTIPEMHGLNELLIPLQDLPSLDRSPVTDDIEVFDMVNDDIEVSDNDGIIFVLDPIPGAPDAEEIVIEDDDDVNVEIEPNPEEVNIWQWKHPTFLQWVQKMFENVPKHSGHDTTGLEKAIAYFEAIDRELTKAMRTDFKNEIDSAKAERAREQIEEGLERLVERLEKIQQTKFKRHVKKSRGSVEDEGLVKEAGKSVNITGIAITVPLLISRVARVCINGMVSAGHSLEDMFHDQVKEYDLTKREQAELCQLLEDMGYPLMLDRGHPVGEKVDKGRNDNYDWAASYPR
jgi:hypothetical protein